MEIREKKIQNHRIGCFWFAKEEMSTTKLRITPAQAAEAAVELDRTDRAILRALQRDASVSNVA